MATLPTEQELPAIPAPNKVWFNEDGTPTVEFAQFLVKLRRFLEDQRAFIEQEHP